VKLKHLFPYRLAWMASHSRSSQGERTGEAMSMDYLLRSRDELP
jgi:hypothetical protein